MTTETNISERLTTWFYASRICFGSLEVRLEEKGEQYDEYESINVLPRPKTDELLMFLISVQDKYRPNPYQMGQLLRALHWAEDGADLKVYVQDSPHGLTKLDDIPF